MSYIGTTKIGGIYLGTTKIGRAYLGGELVFRNGLPTGYTELQYVSTDSHANIDTGVAGAEDLEVYIKFSCSSFVQYGAIYGNYVNENRKCNRAIFATTNSTLYVAGGRNLATLVSGFTLNDTHELSVQSTRAVLDGVETTISASTQSSNTTNICLGNLKVGSVSFQNIGLKIYDFKIRKAGSVVKHYIPCVRDLDSVAGFYDLVADAFVPSSTGTDFTAGPTL